MTTGEVKFSRKLISKALIMAQTNDGKKKVYVHPHTKDDGTKVPPHYRSTPRTSDGPSKKK